MEKLISEFSSGVFFWQTLIFVTLIFLLRKFAWKPILDTINEREKSIRDSLNSAKQARKEMENLTRYLIDAYFFHYFIIWLKISCISKTLIVRSIFVGFSSTVSAGID